MNALELRRRTLGKGVYKKTVEGNPAIAQGSLARRYPGITMQGWTEQAQYEGKNLFDLKELTIPNDRTIIYIPIYLGDGTFTLSTDFEDPSGAFALYLLSGNVQEGAAGTNGVEYLTSKTVVSSEGYVTVAYRRAADMSNPLESNIMLNEGSEPLPYEPYTGGQPSPNPDYPQEIVSAGKLNEETQKWEYEITIANEQTDADKNQTVTLTADRPLTKWDKLEKRNGQWGWVYKSAEVVLDGGNDEAWTLYTTSTAEIISFYTTLYGGIGAMKSSLCDKYINKDYAWNEESLYGIYSDNIGYPGRKYFRPPSADVETVEQWKTWLSENPLTLWYETAEETFVPLSESEQEQMNALHTFRPTTVLSNDCGCNMTLTYKTKKSLEVTD